MAERLAGLFARDDWSAARGLAVEVLPRPDDEPVRCAHCEQCSEHVEMMALFIGIVDPICCGGGPDLGKHVPSCWGCGDDYLRRWKTTDLAPASLFIEDVEKDTKICPDCVEEVEGSK